MYTILNFFKNTTVVRVRQEESVYSDSMELLRQHTSSIHKLLLCIGHKRQLKATRAPPVKVAVFECFLSEENFYNEATCTFPININMCTHATLQPNTCLKISQCFNHLGQLWTFVSLFVMHKLIRYRTKQNITSHDIRKFYFEIFISDHPRL